MQVDVEIPAGPCRVPANKPGFTGLVQGGLQDFPFPHILAADVDVGGVGPHGETGNQATLDQRVRVVAHDFPVLAGAGFGFVGVDDKVSGPAVIALRHEAPFQPRRKPGAAPAPESAALDPVNDGFGAPCDDP